METPLDDARTEPDVAQNAEATSEELVPTWLALVVLILLIALAVGAGYVLRERLTDTTPNSATDLDVREWEAAVEANPVDLDARLSLGFAYQQAERYDEALAQYAFVLEADPDDTAALYNTGVIYLETLELAKAEEALWDVLEVEPTHALAAKQLGEYYAGLGHYRSLITAVEPAADARPEMADLQYLLGYALENLGRPDLAVERYRNALTYAPDMTEAREGLGRVEGAE